MPDDDEFDARYAKIKARYHGLHTPPEEQPRETYDPELAFAEFFDEIACDDLDAAEGYLDELEAEVAAGPVLPLPELHGIEARDLPDWRNVVRFPNVRSRQAR